jgi:hypothetical protein
MTRMAKIDDSNSSCISERVASSTAASAGSHTRRALRWRLLLRGQLKERGLEDGHHDRLG